MADFASALMRARSRSKLTGRPLTEQETAGVAESFAAQAPAIAAQKLHAQELAETRRIQQEQAKRVEKVQKKESRGTAAGAAVGGTAGAMLGGPLGAAVGASIGGTVGGALGGSCIIVTACTSEDSPEVELTRAYRDKFLTSNQILGYYWLASFVVPFIMNSYFVRRMFKVFLVDRLIDHAMVALKYQDKHRYKTSFWISEKFLGLCNFLGHLKKELTKEVVK